MLLIEPLDVNDVGNAGDVPPPVAALLVQTCLAIPFQNGRHVLDMLNRKLAAIAVEMRPDQDAVHHDISVTHRVPAVAVTRPLVAAFSAAMRCPGLTVTYSTVLGGR